MNLSRPYFEAALSLPYLEVHEKRETIARKVDFTNSAAQLCFKRYCILEVSRWSSSYKEYCTDTVPANNNAIANPLVPGHTV
ncbi:unnamed protein product [Rhizophagus irregularis]|nr:unnamed protein product [Rhizophagus irregularis]CAB4404684.1 unnamed protein product [Rhizophagus irregularis]